MYAKTDEKQVYAVIGLYRSGACSKDTLSQTVSSRGNSIDAEDIAIMCSTIVTIMGR